MSIPFVCPGCRKRASAPDEAAGKAVRCPNCKQPVRIPAADGIRPASTSPRPVHRPSSEKESGHVKSRRRRDEFDSDDDRPRRRRRKAAKSNSSMLWILAGGGIAAAVLLTTIGLIFVLRSDSRPAPAIVAQPVPAVVAPAVAVMPGAVPPVPVVVVQRPLQANWIVAFRGNDPSIWGRDVDNGPDRRSISFGQLPKGIRYLRMQECAKNAFVIIPMTNDRLNKDSVDDGIGWNGTGRMEWNGRHLGAYKRAWDQLEKGDISFSTPAFFKGYKGWGFGHRIRNDDVQGFAWNGDAIAPAIFEIAVTTGELGTAEKEHLLGPNAKAPIEVAKVEDDPEPAPADMKAPGEKSQVFVFDGKSRIVTPLERFAPVTLEAWFRASPAPRRRGDRIQYLIGSDIPGQYGYGIGIRYDGNNIGGLQMETVRSFVDSNFPIPAGDWTHVAAVIAPTEVTTFLNGKLTFRQSRNLEIVGGTNFSIGKSGPDATAPYYFTGEIREIRISHGMRYNQPFTPPPTFRKDVNAALIYRASDVKGKTVIDLSGKGRDGQLDGVVVAGEDDKVTSSPGPAIAGGAKEYEPKSKRFTIAMPSGVKTEQMSRAIPLTVPPKKLPAKGVPSRPVLSVETASTRLADGTRFTAASLELPEIFLDEVPDAGRLEVYRDAFLKGANGQIVSETEIRQGRYVGREYHVDLLGGHLRMQLLVLGGAGCYAMVETNSIERLASRDVDEFFDSFKIKE
jgi:Concanavalin A-like lectin/glucanases superfamily